MRSMRTIENHLMNPCDHIRDRTVPLDLYIFRHPQHPFSTHLSPCVDFQYCIAIHCSGEATVNMDCQIEADSLDSALQIREEWDLPEEKLLDLKRLQRRMSIGSMAGMQTAVTVKRPGWGTRMNHPDGASALSQEV